MIYMNALIARLSYIHACKQIQIQVYIYKIIVDESRDGTTIDNRGEEGLETAISEAYNDHNSCLRECENHRMHASNLVSVGFNC